MKREPGDFGSGCEPRDPMTSWTPGALINTLERKFQKLDQARSVNVGNSRHSRALGFSKQPKLRLAPCNVRARQPARGRVMRGLSILSPNPPNSRNMAPLMTREWTTMANARVRMAKYIFVTRTQRNPITAAKAVEKTTPKIR